MKSTKIMKNLTAVMRKNLHKSQKNPLKLNPLHLLPRHLILVPQKVEQTTMLL